MVVAILFALFVYFLERTATLPFGRESLDLAPPASPNLLPSRTSLNLLRNSVLRQEVHPGLRFCRGNHPLHWFRSHVCAAPSFVRPWKRWLSNTILTRFPFRSPGQIKSANIEFLEITRSFYPSTE